MHFIFKSDLKEMNCDYYQCSSPSESLDLDINTFIGGRPLGYKAKLHFAIAGRGSADIRLSDSRFDSIKRNNYEIGINILFTSQLKRKKMIAT